MTEKSSQSNIWGRKIEKVVNNLQDVRPFLSTPEITLKDKMQIFFYPEKFLLFSAVRKAVQKKKSENRQNGKFNKVKVLDIGCGTGATIIEMKKIWGKEIEVYGVDSMNLQADLAKQRIKEYGVWADIGYYDGNLLPFKNNFFDIVISSGEVNKFYDSFNWFEEVSRILIPGGRLAISLDSKLGKNSYIAKYFDNRGVDIYEESEHHFLNKEELEKQLQENSLEIKKMYNLFFSSFFLHPENYFQVLQKQKKFWLWKVVNKLLMKIKTKSPIFLKRFFSVCLLLKILTLGRFWQDRGYVVLVEKKHYNR